MSEVSTFGPSRPPQMEAQATGGLSFFVGCCLSHQVRACGRARLYGCENDWVAVITYRGNAS